MDKLLLFKRECWINYVQILEITLNKLKESGLKCSIEKSLFIQTKMEYLGFWVTRDGIKTPG